MLRLRRGSCWDLTRYSELPPNSARCTCGCRPANAELSYFLSSVSNVYAVKCQSPDLKTVLWPDSGEEEEQITIIFLWVNHVLANLAEISG